MNWALLHSSIEATGDTAEAYVLGHLNGSECREYEEHLLVCGKCREAVDTVEEFITVLRQATSQRRLRLPA